jgi:hypothetical protein
MQRLDNAKLALAGRIYGAALVALATIAALMGVAAVLQALPIIIPAARTKEPPRTTCKAARQNGVSM